MRSFINCPLAGFNIHDFLDHVDSRAHYKVPVKEDGVDLNDDLKEILNDFE